MKTLPFLTKKPHLRANYEFWQAKAERRLLTDKEVMIIRWREERQTSVKDMKDLNDLFYGPEDSDLG